MSSNQCPTHIEFLGPFSELPDPRKSNATKHNFHEMMVISLSACLAGADNFVAIERFAKAKIKFFEQFIPLKSGIPSHDAFGDLYALLDSQIFNKCFIEWIKDKQNGYQELQDTEIIALDGKSLRRSHDKVNSKKMLHTVNAWACKQGRFIGQQSVDKKSNEITAIPKLLELLWIKNSIVTIDAMGTQKEICSKIIEQEADYVLSLKDNHPTFFEEVTELFESPETLKNMKELGVNIDIYKTLEKSHGREETRHCIVIESTDWYREHYQWAGLKSFVLVERTRKEKGKDVTVEQHYYITSLPADASRILDAVRSHWGIENSLHWVLDVSWNEDQSRARLGNAAENLSLLRKISINLHKESSRKDSLKGKQQIAGWDESYLKELLQF